MAINILRVTELDVWKWLEQSSHHAMHGTEWLNVRSSDRRALIAATLWLAVADRVVIDAGRQARGC